MRSLLVSFGVLVLMAGLVGCTPDDPSTSTATQAVEAPAAPAVDQHETLSGSPIASGITVPDGSTQLGPLVRRRSKALIDAYADVLVEAKRREAVEAAKDQEDPPTAPSSTPPVQDRPIEDTYAALDEIPPPDITTALIRIDGDPSEVFERLVGETADALPTTQLDPSRWSQFCRAEDGVYTGCTMSVRGRTGEGEGVQVVATVDPGDIATKTAPAGSDLHPVMTVTVITTDPPEPSDALAPDPSASPETTSTPSATPSPTPSPTPPPVSEAPLVDAEWPTMSKEAAVEPGRPVVTTKWLMRSYATLLLSGDRPAFTMMVTTRKVDADAVARSFVLPYSTTGPPRRNVVEDRNEYATTYRAQHEPGEPDVSVTYTQSGRGNYISMFYRPPA